MHCSPKWRNASESQAPPWFAQQLLHPALHPLRDAAPLTGRYTRSERVHCLHIGCTAYASGAAPTLAQPRRVSGSPQPTPRHRPLHDRARQSVARQPAAYAAPLSPHSPIPHAIPRRPDALTPQKPQDFNVLTSKVEVCARELHAKFGGHTQHPRVSIRVTRRSASKTVHHCRALHQLGSITPPGNWCNTHLNGVTPLSNKPRRGQRPADAATAEPRRHQQMPAQKLRRSAAL